jgi:hypothetical protein
VNERDEAAYKAIFLGIDANLRVLINECGEQDHRVALLNYLREAVTECKLKDVEPHDMLCNMTKLIVGLWAFPGNNRSAESSGLLLSAAEVATRHARVLASNIYSNVNMTGDIK